MPDTDTETRSDAGRSLNGNASAEERRASALLLAGPRRSAEYSCHVCGTRFVALRISTKKRPQRYCSNRCRQRQKAENARVARAARLERNRRRAERRAEKKRAEQAAREA